eukprot:m.29786 g.29786  ORF g.29786 m.29786 type:complete len:674 (-) comp16159_c0_seq1:187-2208(-)
MFVLSPAVLVAAVTLSTTTSIAPGTVMNNTCYGGAGSTSYNSYPLPDGTTSTNALASCSSSCTTDNSLCWGVFLKYNTHSGGFTCNTLSGWADDLVFPCAKGNIVARIGDWHSKPVVTPKPAPKNAKNVLFLISDDMRPDMGPYARPGTEWKYSTPNFDKLAKTGITFTRAYIQFSYCAPSRNSFMSGRRPDATKAYSFMGTFRQPGVGQDWDSLPEHFRNNGYNVGGVNKLFHPGVPSNDDAPYAWTVPYQQFGSNATNLCADNCCGISSGPASEDAQNYCAWDVVPGTYLEDQRGLLVVKEHLNTFGKDYKDSGKPFFLGFGTHKPHLTWDFPREFWDRIPANVTAAQHRAYPADVPAMAWHECAECSSAKGQRIMYSDTNGNGGPLPSLEWEAGMRRAYYACISYVDDLFGQVLDQLDTMGLTDSTAVVFTGDHGWNLGEHDIWCKMTNFETGTRVPLLFRAPWMKNAVGVKTKALAELVDMYPTLSELVLGPNMLPTGQGGANLGGTSLVPVFANPTGPGVKDVALSQFPRCWQNNTGWDKHNGALDVHTGLPGPGDEINHTTSLNSMSDCHWMRRENIDFMGYTMRTESVRYTEWVRWDGKSGTPIWEENVGTEFYNHSSESQYDNSYMDDTENVNLASLPQNAEQIKALSAKLHMEVAKWMVPWHPM